MKVKLDARAICPTRAHEWDAGLDLYTPEDVTVPPAKIINTYVPITVIAGGIKTNSMAKKKTVEIGSATIDTGVHIELPTGTTGFIKSKSGLNVRHGLIADGVIDVGYTGSIAVKLYNNSGEAYSFKRGEKIAQLVILNCSCPKLQVVNELKNSERGNDGFGSTGR